MGMKELLGDTPYPPASRAFDGGTYDPDRDFVRLNAQQQRVADFLILGGWWSLRAISAGTGDPEASVSARLRDLRKLKWGGHTVERKRFDGGLWKYRLVPATMQQAAE